MTTRTFHSPLWDRGEAIDAEMLAFTIGDDWIHDQRLVVHDMQGSMAHAKGLLRAGLIKEEDHDAIQGGLAALLESNLAGEWSVEAGDEDVHSAVERRLTALIGDAGKRLHTGRSRNDQVALDMRLWLRDAIDGAIQQAQGLRTACESMALKNEALPLPGYTHLRRAMPSSIADWASAHARALGADIDDLIHARSRISECPLGSGAGYGVPLALDREFVAEELGFARPEEPVTLTQHSRGRAELAYVTALEALALDLGKLAADLWLFSTGEFGFAKLPVAFTTGSSMMPQKRNPDLIELTRAQCRQVIADRAALVDVMRDLPSGYHRDFQMVKPPLFRAHDRVASLLSIWTRFLPAIEFNESALREAAADEGLQATQRALEAVKSGATFRDAYRAESAGATD